MLVVQYLLPTQGALPAMQEPMGSARGPGLRPPSPGIGW